jgi:hypothetical protein
VPGLPDTARAAAKRLSPRHRRWRRLLDSLTLDPDRLPRPVMAPGTRDFVICGCPRTGTALLTAMLFQPPRVVTVMEPWDGMRLPPAELFASLRAEMATGRLRRGRLDLSALEHDGTVRWCRDGETSHRVEARPDHLLGVKWPAFWRYLDLLPTTRFLVCLRDPTATIQSFAREGGRLAQGLDYDTPFNRAMNEALIAATPVPAERRVLLYDYINERLVPHLTRPNVLVVRFERWFTEPAALVADIGRFLGVELRPDVARIDGSRPHPTGDDETLALVRRYCRTAGALGYPTP